MRAFVLMPDHVPLLFTLGETHTLDQVLYSFSSFTAHKINAHLTSTSAVWQEGYYDHGVRTEEALEPICAYIINNPVVAGYVEAVHLWRWVYPRPSA